MSGKYNRIRITNPRQRRRRRRKDVEASFARKPSRELTSRLILALLLGVPLVILLFLGIQYLINHKWDDEVPPMVEEPLKTAPTKARLGLLPGQIADKFLAASTLQERLRWVHQPAEVSALMEHFYRDGPGSMETIADFHEMPPAATEDHAFERFMVSMADGSKRLLCIPFEESGNAFGVDFKSYARHCSEDWSKVLDGSAAKADEMRVFLKEGSYYNYEFADESEWLCLIATSPELENPIYLYARKNNPDLLLFIHNPPKQSRRYTVALENSGQSHLNRQWQLTRVHATSWVAP